MTLEWVLFTFVLSLLVCTIVIASLVKCYYCNKLKAEESIRVSDKKIVDLLNKINERYDELLKSKNNKV